MYTNQSPVNFIFRITLTVFMLWATRGNPIGSTNNSKLDELSTVRYVHNSDDYSHAEENVTQGLKCDPVEYELKDVTILKNNDIFLESQNLTLHSSEYKMENGRIFRCVSFHPKVENLSVLNCSEKFIYEKHEFSILPNNSAIVGEYVVPKGEFELSGDYLLTCAPEEDESAAERTLQDIFNYGGRIGSIISKMENLSVLNCSEKFDYEKHEFHILPNNSAIVGKTIFPVQKYELNGDILSVCAPIDNQSAEVMPQEKDKLFVLKCSEKFDYRRHEFRILPNNSAVVGRNIIPEWQYELSGDILSICVPEEGELPGVTLIQISIYVGLAGSCISIVALIGHLLTFLFLPTLRNLPGYNLASLSVAFLLAYSFVVIGQLPQVVGLSCVISAILQQNFFLAAFFCMNVLAFDVWRSFKLATEKLRMEWRISVKRKFFWYSLYAWGVPLSITAVSVIVDNADSAPTKLKPHYGNSNICWMTNSIAQAIFFVAPAFTLLLVNVIFFGMSSWTISSNTLKVTKDQSKQTVKLNYILYVKLALMMGVTWLVGLIAIVSRNDVISLLFNLLNSLQGLFLFLLFSCTKTVMKQFSVNFASSSSR